MGLAIAQKNKSELRMVGVEEVPYLPEFIEEVRETAGTAACRFHGVIQRARALAEEQQIDLNIHILAVRPVHDNVKLAADLDAALLIIGARGCSALYERMIGSRADRNIQLAQCPVLIMK